MGREKADSVHTLASTSVYAYGLAVRVRSIAFSDDDTCGILAITKRLLRFLKNGKLPLADSLDRWVRGTLGLRLDTHGTCSDAGLPGRTRDRLRILRHQNRFSTIPHWNRLCSGLHLCSFPSDLQKMFQ